MKRFLAVMAVLVALVLMTWCTSCQAPPVVIPAPTTPAPTVTTTNPAPQLASLGQWLTNWATEASGMVSRVEAYLVTLAASLPQPLPPNASGAINGIRQETKAAGASIADLQAKAATIPVLERLVSQVSDQRDQWQQRSGEQDAIITTATHANASLTTENADLKHQLDDQWHRMMMYAALVCGGLIVPCLGIAALGVYIKNEWVIVGGLLAAVGCVMGVIVFHDLDIVVRHPIWSTLIAAALIGVPIGIWLLGKKLGWWTDKMALGVAKLAQEAVNGADTDVSEVAAAMRSMPQFAKVWGMAKAIAAPALIKSMPG